MIIKMVVQETLLTGLRKDDSLGTQCGLRDEVAPGSAHLGLLLLSWRRCCCTSVRGRQVPGGTTCVCVRGLCPPHLSRQRPKCKIRPRQTQRVGHLAPPRVLWDYSQTTAWFQMGTYGEKPKRQSNLITTQVPFLSWIANCPLCIGTCIWDTHLVHICRIALRSFWIHRLTDILADIQSTCVWGLFISISCIVLLCESSVKTLVCVKFQLKWFKIPLHLLFHWF